MVHVSRIFYLLFSDDPGKFRQLVRNQGRSSTTPSNYSTKGYMDKTKNLVPMQKPGQKMLQKNPDTQSPPVLL